jgi:predicted esterase
MNETHTIETKTHGRYLVRRGASQRLLVGFHGYAENAERHMAELEKLEVDWTLVAVQALHPFYTRTEEVVASWMTRQDRELAIADNIEYIRRVVEDLGPHDKLVFAGFSQGAAMAYRAATRIRCDGLIILGGDLPPDVTSLSAPVLLGRGERDDWYTAEKFEKDLRFLKTLVPVDTCVFDGGHEWCDAFRQAAADFLRRSE